MSIDKQTLDEIINLLIPHCTDIKSRQTLVRAAMPKCSVLQNIDWEGSALDFVVQLVDKLLAFGNCETGQPTLTTLLLHLKKQVGLEQQETIDTLIERIPVGFNPLEIKTGKRRFYAIIISLILLPIIIFAGYQTTCYVLMCSVTAPTFYDEAVAHTANGEWQAAIEDFTRAINRGYTTPANAYFRRAVALGEMDEWAAAIDDYNRAIEEGYGYIYLAYFNLAIAYLENKQFDDALETVEIAITLTPQQTIAENGACAYIVLGDIYYAEDNADRDIVAAFESYTTYFEQSSIMVSECDERTATDRIGILRAMITPTATP